MAAAAAQTIQQLPLDAILHGDCLALLRSLPDASVDAVVTDPPYGLSREPDIAEVLTNWLAGDTYQHRASGFMGKTWDSFVPGPEYWQEVARVLKPGGHVLAFGGTRTYDLLTIALRMARLEIRECLYWVHGQGFPKSLDVSKALDRMAGAEREVIARTGQRCGVFAHSGSGKVQNIEDYEKTITAPATDAAREWAGWGTALKPAVEPIILCRKPLAESSVAANVLAHGTGALHVDACRVPHGDDIDLTRMHRQHAATSGMRGIGGSGYKSDHVQPLYAQAGRFPPNILFSHSLFCTDAACHESCPVRELDAQSGITHSSGGSGIAGDFGKHGRYGRARGVNNNGIPRGFGGTGGASRFFPQFRYVSKPSRRERGEGNTHPTVKSTSLMSWLITLITPPGGIVLDPFAGSGSTCVAAKAGGWHYIGMEREAEYVEIAERRLAGETPKPRKSAKVTPIRSVPTLWGGVA